MNTEPQNYRHPNRQTDKICVTIRQVQVTIKCQMVYPAKNS